ncbi:MAG: hypothetical protein ACP5N1_00875 [Candidatus Woesearchaeota archaeon]
MITKKQKLKLLFLSIIFVLFLAVVILLTKNNSISHLNETDKLLIEESYNLALSYYPELSETKIFLKYRELDKRTMNARPKANFIFLSKENREYNIIINTNYKDGAITIMNYSSEGKVGMFGHELGHIYDYSGKTTGDMIIFGAGYVFSKTYMQKTERKTDQIAIDRGLGKELYNATLFQYTNKDYWLDKEGIYYNPQDILDLMILNN